MERDYAFPFEPYQVQKDFMDSLYDCLHNKKAGIFESPTGTGKSLSLICASFKWLRDNPVSAADSQHYELTGSQAWLNDIGKAEKENRKEEAKALTVNILQPKKVVKTTKEDTVHRNSQNADRFLVLEKPVEEVKTTTEINETISINSFVPPRILYISRTHSQLDQFIGEVKRTKWGTGPDKIRVIRLGSRNQLCINEHLSKYKKTSAINYKCKELIDPENRTADCVWHQGQHKIVEHAMSNVCDIEDLIRAGNEHVGCPYYGSRSALTGAEVIVAPYASILNKSVREGVGVSLENVILIIDEAHNLMESIIDSYSATLSKKQVENSLRALNNYFSRYHSRLSSRSTMYMKQMLKILMNFGNFINKNAGNRNGIAVKVADFLVDQDLVDYDFYKICDFVEEIDLTRKIIGFSESADFTPVDAGFFHFYMEFLRCLSTDPSDSRILIDFGDDRQPTLRYLLLNPAIPFKAILKESRSVILAGGTMDPIEEFLDLFKDITRDQLTLFKCGHVIPTENLLMAIVPKGESGAEFKFTYENRDREILMEDLCKLLVDVSTAVPHGVVVFLPSYHFLKKLEVYLTTSEFLSRIQSRKKIFFDNKDENILEQYSRIAMTSGAMLFAVVRGKLSEGINFSNQLGRCVIMVGLPYLSRYELEVQERMKFLDSKRTSFNGRMFYENSCHKAINQSIGRAIRHRGDFAVVLLVDSRHAIEKRPQ